MTGSVMLPGVRRPRDGSDRVGDGWRKNDGPLTISGVGFILRGMATQEMTPARFVEKWKAADLPERAASQEHFIDLCRLLGQPTPAEHDATGAEYAFEKGVAVTDSASKGAKGERGFADVWWRGKFAWEYKRKDKYKDLSEAYRQLCQYREALENPPVLVVCDIGRTEIHTNFTGTAKQVHAITLDEVNTERGLGLLRRVFTNPGSFKPAQTCEHITRDVAEKFARLSQRLEARGVDPHAGAHFLMKCMFCLFAEDIGLLPKDLFKELLQSTHAQPERFAKYAGELFGAMRTGGDFLLKQIPWFNGGLFDESPAVALSQDDLGVMLLAAGQDWSSVEPAIFGTLFERSLDPEKRAQIGAHYTSREDILLVVEPVVMAPLRGEWEAVQAKVEELLGKRKARKDEAGKKRVSGQIGKALQGFLDRLAGVRILDPACGSGNFLYVAIQQLLYLEKEVITYAARPEIALGLLPGVRPTQLHGIEINPYAAELAQVVIWIGYLQWMRDNGFAVPRDPILEPLQTIENRDAILAWSDKDGKGLPVWQEGAKCLGAAGWPEADYIVGNPPFLGSKVFRQNGLPDEYISALYTAYDLPRTSDLCCYWFELGYRAISRSPRLRVGLLATQGIRGGDNRTVLERIKQAGDVFLAWSDKDWVLEGAAVHVSIVGFDSGSEGTKRLDGLRVERINADLSSDIDLSATSGLESNNGYAFMGVTPSGPFEIDLEQARKLLETPNPTGRSNCDVVRPWANATRCCSSPQRILDCGLRLRRGHDCRIRVRGPVRVCSRQRRAAARGLQDRETRLLVLRAAAPGHAQSTGRKAQVYRYATCVEAPDILLV